MKFPTIFILNIIISQIFFTTSSYIIDLFRVLIIKLISSNSRGKILLNKYSIFIYPIITIIFFTLIGVILYLIMEYLKDNEIKQKNLKNNEIKEQEENNNLIENNFLKPNI